MPALRAVFLTLLLFVLVVSVAPPTRAAAAPAPAPSKTPQSLGNTALAFVPNVGQVAPTILFQARAPRGTIAFARDHVALTVPLAANADVDQAPSPLTREYGSVALYFENANRAPEITRGQRKQGVMNFLRGNDPTQWRSNVPTYAGITYKNLYDGIDLAYDGIQGLLKGNYFIAAGADPNVIRWRYEGAARVRVEADGALYITLPQTREDADGRVRHVYELIERAPKAWQIVNGARQEVAVKFALNEQGTIGFELGAYNAAQPLTIDPEFGYAKMLSGSGQDYAYSIAVDPAGNAYITGMTTSVDFFTTEGAFDKIFDGDPNCSLAAPCEDAFVVKLAADGELIYSTFLGGSNEDRAEDVAADEAGRAYIVGSTFSGDFPLKNPYQTTNNHSAFVTVLSPDGGALEYSTKYGSSGLNIGTSVAVDSEGFVYVGGYTTSFDLPTRNAFQASNLSCQCENGYTNSPLFEGVTDSFVAVFNPARFGVDSLRFASYYGGSGEDFLRELAVDIAGNIFAIGDTDSPDLNTPLSYDNNCAVGEEGYCLDAFVIKVNVIAKRLDYATYLGGSKAEGGHGIALADNSGDVYVAGATASTDFPLRLAYDSSFGGWTDAFYVKLDTDVSGAQSLLYGTYLGGMYHDTAYSIAVNQLETPYVYGFTTSENFPVTQDAIQPQPGRPAPPYSCDFELPDACSDAFLTQFSTDGANLEYSTFFGSAYDDNDFAFAVGVAVKGFDVYLAGFANDDHLTNELNPTPIVRGAFRNVFVGKFSSDSDGDGLPDTWETNGVTLGGEFLDLPAMGARPDHKDVFVHADWMADFLKPTNADMAVVLDAFYRAPLTNPDGRNGINLHIDLGSDSVMNPETGATWGAYSRAGLLPYAEATGAFNGLSYNWDAFEELEEMYFIPAKNREHVFHYAAFLNTVPRAANNFQPAGIARTIPGHEFLIALGNLDQVGSIRGGTGLQKALTFMHELGHALGLNHGGVDEVNYKPNYLSVMNYHFSATGLIKQNGQRVIDYARYALPSLNEEALDEIVGIQAPDTFQTFWAPVGNNAAPEANAPTFGGCGHDRENYNRALAYPALDWDCSGDLTLAPTRVDLNIDGRVETLESYEDWHRIRFDGNGTIGDFSGLFADAVEEPFDGVGIEEQFANLPPQLILAEINAPQDNVCYTPTRGSAPLLVHFDGRASTDPDGTIERYEWDFGDGTTGEGALIDHTYTQFGIYYATLAVYDNDGKVNLIPERLEINVGESQHAPPCNVALTADLDVDVYATPEPARQGAQLQYDIYLANLGPDAVSDAVVNVTLPNGTTFAQTFGEGNCTTPDVGMGGDVSCAFGYFNVEGSCSECSTGARQTLIVNVLENAPSTVQVTFSATTNQNETQPNNNSQAVTTNVLPPRHAFVSELGNCGAETFCFANLQDALDQLTANDRLTLLDGTHTLAYNTTLRRLIVNAGATLDTGENVLTLTGIFNNQGIVRNRSFASNFARDTSFTFLDALGRSAAQIALNDAGDMGDTTVITTLNGSPANTNCGTFGARGILRVFDITPTQTAQVSATLRLHYDALTEGNGTSANTVTIYHCENGAWHELTGDYVRGAENGLNYVELAGVTNFSPFALGGAAPTASELNAFEAAALSANQVRVTWETANELNLIGFNLYRALENAEEIQLNAALIPAQNVGSINGAPYEFLDDAARANTTYRYRLELVRADGSTFSETFSITTPNECGNVPAAPTMLAPNEGKKILKKKVTLKWSADACAASYELVARKQSADGEIVLQKSGIPKTQLKLKNLGKGKYVWQVRGCVGGNAPVCGEWSAWARFVMAGR